MRDWSRTAEQMMLAAVESKIRVLAVTSVHSGSGVSTAARGLAVACARSGRKTLLIDLTATVQPADLAGAWSPGAPLPPDAVRSSDDGLSVLTVVPTSTNRTLFGNVELLQKVFQRDLAGFATIIVELPAVGNEEAERLNPVAAARAADAVVLVALTGLTTRDELSDGTQRLRQVGATIAGIVLNDRYCATLGEEIADVSYTRLGRVVPRLADWIAQKALANSFLNRNFRIVR